MSVNRKGPVPRSSHPPGRWADHTCLLKLLALLCFHYLLALKNCGRRVGFCLEGVELFFCTLLHWGNITIAYMMIPLFFTYCQRKI